jgi:HKD family nuclease
MKLLTTAIELENEFKRLMEDYNNFHWATAWASSGSVLFKQLLYHKQKTKKIVVGIHFYQTHPDFIEAFLNNQKVHFIQQPQGTFHPKVYLFSNNQTNWELIVGSANFTAGAFSCNTEVNLLITQEDDHSNNIYKAVIEIIEQTFNLGITYKQTDLDNYRIIWENQKEKIKSLSGQYGSKMRKPKPILEVPMLIRNWKQFMEEVDKEGSENLSKRLKVIEIAQELFNKVNHFDQLTEDERKFIAGIPNKLDIEGADDWAYFGSMRGAGFFKNKIKQNDHNISKALDQIPLGGQITKKHYDDFIKYYTKVFPGNYIATATRLLCMKRPDIFVCFDSKNRSALCTDFGIVQKGMNYEKYWEDVIARIYDSNWWKNPDPKNNSEKKVSGARAAMLDSIYYEQ